MTLIRFALIIAIGAVGDALFPAGLFKAALGLPPHFCPTGTLAAGISVAHLLSVAAFLFVVLSALRRALGMMSSLVVAATIGSIVASALLGWSLDQGVVASWIRAHSASPGAAWDAVRWVKALGTGAGALMGLAIWTARQNNQMQRARHGGTEPRR